MPRQTFFLCITTCIGFNHMAHAQKFTISDPDTEEIYFLGSEILTCDKDLCRKESIYSLPSGKPSHHELTLFHPSSLAVTEYRYSDFITKDFSEVKLTGDQYLLKTKKHPETTWNEGLLSAKPHLYTSSLAKELIEKSWSELQSDAAIVFDLIIPQRLSSFKFRIKKILEKDPKYTSFSASPDHFFIRIFAPEMTFRYSSDRKLRQYLGPSPTPIKGENFKILRISFAE